jgi:putative ABC transport system substrate-binding protein
MLTAFVEGLAETGYVVGRNVRIEFRHAENLDQFPSLASDLVRLKPAVIACRPTAAALGAKQATSTIPIVFGTGDDPVRLGLVASLAHPGGNLTGTTNLNVELEAKRLAMLHEIVPSAVTLAALVDSKNPAADRQVNTIEQTARSLSHDVRILTAANEREIDTAFRTIVRESLGALFVATDGYFASRRAQIVALAAYNEIPALYSGREFPEAGGLASYAADGNALLRQQGIYVGRILKGERPFDLPVVQATKFELVINLKTAKDLGIQIPARILALADAVVE